MPIDVVITITGVLALSSFTICWLALHVLPTGYSPIRDPVSNYAVGRFGILYSAQAATSGVAALCLLALLLSQEAALPMVGLIALAIYAASRLLIVFFPTDVKPPRTTAGTIHAVLAATTFSGVATAAGVLTPALIALPAWSGVETLLRADAVVTYGSAIAFAIVLAIKPLHGITGLVERGIYIGTLTWFAVNFGMLLQTL